MAMEKNKRPRAKQVMNPNIRCFFESDGKHSFGELFGYQELSLNNASSSSVSPLFLSSALAKKGDLNEAGTEKFLVMLLKVDDLLPLLR